MAELEPIENPNTIVWDVDVPRGSEASELIDDIIRSIKVQVLARMQAGHFWNSGKDIHADGLHLMGSARAYIRVNDTGITFPDPPFPDSDEFSDGHLLILLPGDQGPGDLMYWRARAESVPKKKKWVSIPLGFLKADSKRVIAPAIFIPENLVVGFESLHLSIPKLNKARITRLVARARAVDELGQDEKAEDFISEIHFLADGQLITGSNQTSKLELAHTDKFNSFDLPSDDAGNKGVSLDDKQFLSIRVVRAGKHRDVLCTFEGFDNLIVE